MRAILIGCGLVIFGTLLVMALSQCGVNWFPKCDEPGNKCPPLGPNEDHVPYPAGPRFAREGGTHFVDAGARDAPP